MVVLIPPHVWVDMSSVGGSTTFTTNSNAVFGGGCFQTSPTSNLSNVQVVGSSYYSSNTCTNGETFWWTGTGTGTCATNSIYMPNIIVVPTDVEYVLDEEDYLNNQEYWDLAQQRGVRWRIRTEQERAAQAAEAERIERQRAVERERAERARQERAQAETTAFELLLEFLTPQQREDMERHGYFYVRGGSSGTRYRINTRGGYQHNIDIMRSDDRRVADLCAHCRDEVPKYDHFLAQKFNLEIDEDKFLRIANRRAA